MSDLLTRPAAQAPAQTSAPEPMLDSFSDLLNPVGLDGVEFVEYATSRPQALGQVLEMMGFKPVARHRSREVLLYRQGGLNVVVNAHPDEVRGATHGAGGGVRGWVGGGIEAPTISAIALRVRDARAAYQRMLDRGAWAVPAHAQVMELNIPAIHGAGGSRLYFVDRYKEFSIYSVDFVPIPGVDPHPPAVAGLHFFGVVQYIGAGRCADWMEFYQALLGFTLIPDERRFGIMPKGKLMRSPHVAADSGFLLQLVEPDDATAKAPEFLQRIGLGTPHVPAAVAALRQLGMEFVETPHAATEQRGAISKTYLGGVVFELVHSEPHRTPNAAQGQP